MSEETASPKGRRGFLRGRQQAEPYYRDLEEAFELPGCPVCRLLADSADRYLDGVLWEMVLDHVLRAEINEARGYCQQHGWLLDRVGAALGAAILTRGIIKTLLDELESHPVRGTAESARNSLRRSLGRKQPSGATAGLIASIEPQRPCPLCTHLEDLGEHITATLVAHLEEPDGLASVFRDSDGLCQAHFRQALASVPSAAAGRTLAEAQGAIWRRLYDELGEFIRKKDFQNKGETLVQSETHGGGHWRPSRDRLPAPGVRGHRLRGGLMTRDDTESASRLTGPRLKRWGGLLLLLALLSLLAQAATHAQGSGQVQELAGTIVPGDVLYYRLPGLEGGQTLYVYVENMAGNLDPIVGLLDGGQDPLAWEKEYGAVIQDALAEGRDPVLAVVDAANSQFLVWDDDSGEGLAATFAFPVPASGDYLLGIAGSLTALGHGTFGDYRLLVGLDASEVASGEASDSGDIITYLDREVSPPRAAAEELTGTLTKEQPSQILELRDFQPGDTLYAYVESTSGALRPALSLLNYADKPVRIANLAGQDRSGTLEYTLDEVGRGYALEIVGCCEGASAGDYRLLVGVNAPEVLAGQATPRGRPVIKEPIPVQIGIKLQQIVEVNEQNEFFTVVASMQMQWTDPALAFNPDDCDCVVKTYTQNNFDDFLADTGGRWPEFTLVNQQGNRWTQNQLAVVHQDGQATYFERFSTDLQVDFDFRRYPFDEQEFAIRVDAIYPEHFLYFTDLEGYSEIGPDHGEDEFAIDEFETEVSSEQASTLFSTSRFTFRFGGPRHLDYYLIQIFLPIVLITAVSWVTFFLRDYTRRIEVASANLLLFIAFSFSLADNYPRLGYVTLLDAVMVGIFVVNALVVIYNVWLRRMEMNDQGELANRIDSYLDWIYPIGYIVAAVVLYWLFF